MDRTYGQDQLEAYISSLFWPRSSVHLPQVLELIMWDSYYAAVAFYKPTDAQCTHPHTKQERKRKRRPRGEDAKKR